VPGQWPVTPVPDPDEYGAVYVEFQRLRARRWAVLDLIKANLEEQPSPRAVRSCARDWVADVLALAEDVAKNKMEHPE
jgi:hypothetical protein